MDHDALVAHLKGNLDAVRDRIEAATERSGRSAGSVTLVAVSKTWPGENVQAAIDAGATTLGENRIQEAQAKIPGLSGDPTWHLVGHLQRNKAKAAVELFDVVQSVDSVRLASALSRHASESGRDLSVLVQVNTSHEGSKSGFEPEETHDAVSEVAELPGLRVAGLMTIATFTGDEAEVRRCFKVLRKLKDGLPTKVPELSMGMTGDFEAAIEEGATVVRIGTAIFGQRAV